MSNEPAQFHTSAIRLPQEWEWDIMRRYAETAVKSKLVGTDKNPVTVDQALFLILKGYELGITPLQSLAEIHLISGKPGLSVQLMIGLANRSGMISTLDMPDATEAYSAKKATVTGIRRDRPDSPVTMTFSMDDAKAAGLLGNPTWGKYPGQMLVNRAMSMVLRRLIPEALSGMYLAEELEGIEREPWSQADETKQLPSNANNGAPQWWPILKEYKPFMLKQDFDNMTADLSDNVKAGHLYCDSMAIARAHIENTYKTWIDMDALTVARKEME